MKEIKYKIWHKIGTTWTTEEHCVKGDLCVYTGLKYKNGREIYEGDIVKGYTHVSPVIYTDDGVGSCGCCYPAFEGIGFMAEDIQLSECEVIGNIYENPELLEQNNEETT